MDRVEVSTVVYCSKAEVYEFLLDFPRYTRLSKHLREVTQDGDGSPGTEYDLTFAWWKLSYTAHSRVTDVDPPDRIDWELTQDLDAHGSWLLEDDPDADGHTDAHADPHRHADADHGDAEDTDERHRDARQRNGRAERNRHAGSKRDRRARRHRDVGRDGDGGRSRRHRLGDADGHADRSRHADECPTGVSTRLGGMIGAPTRGSCSTALEGPPKRWPPANAAPPRADRRRRKGFDER